MTAKFKIELHNAGRDRFTAIINDKPWVTIKGERHGHKPTIYTFYQIHGSGAVFAKNPPFNGNSGNRQCIRVAGVPKDMPRTITLLERKLGEMAEEGLIEPAVEALAKKEARDAQRKIRRDKEIALERAREAGPDLLAALKFIVEGIECGGIVAADPMFDAKLKKNLETAKTAIRKAERTGDDE